jgi:hypothetical protein
VEGNPDKVKIVVPYRGKYVFVGHADGYNIPSSCGQASGMQKKSYILEDNPILKLKRKVFGLNDTIMIMCRSVTTAQLR